MSPIFIVMSLRKTWGFRILSRKFLSFFRPTSSQTKQMRFWEGTGRDLPLKWKCWRPQRKVFLCHNQNVLWLRLLIVSNSPWGLWRWMVPILCPPQLLRTSCLQGLILTSWSSLNTINPIMSLFPRRMRQPLTLTQIAWFSLSRVLILLKCHHFGISRFNREIWSEFSLMPRSFHLRHLNACKVKIWTRGF